MSDLTNNHLRGKSRADQNYLFELRTLPRMHSAIKRDINGTRQQPAVKTPQYVTDVETPRFESSIADKRRASRGRLLSVCRELSNAAECTSRMQIKSRSAAKRIKIEKEESLTASRGTAN